MHTFDCSGIKKVNNYKTLKEKLLARRGGGLRAAIKVVKAIDRANKQAARESQRMQRLFYSNVSAK
ncbi:hypothetical protein E4T16_22955 [Vibrio parahaemolyticus]|nr:hypothetical protein [Vibrio parahaemolyticus]EGR0688450.1 hypothetical protein [Vibrio parahaemolyticus]